jgi:hypothetical protein
MPIIGGMVNKMNGTLQAAIDNGDDMLVAEIRGRQAVGTMALMGMVTLMMNTEVTGNLPHDQASRDAWKAENRPPYSILINGHWVSYLAFEPFTSMLSIVADAGRLAKMGAADAASQALSQLGYSISAAFTDRSMLSGFSDISALIEPDGTQANQWAKFALSKANTAVPLAGARRALANSLSPYTNELRGEVDRMLVAAIPGMANELPVQTNWVSGEKIYSNAGGLFNANSAIRIHKATTNKTLKALTDLSISPMQFLKTGENGVPLKPEQREELSKILFTSGLPKALGKLMDSEGWKAMKDTYTGASPNMDMVVNSEDLPEHIKLVKELISSYKTRALVRLRQTNTEYANELMAAKLTRKNAQKGIRTRVTGEDLIKFGNP